MSEQPLREQPVRASLRHRPRAPHVLIAPDKFKGTLSAAQATAAIKAGVLQVCPEARVSSVPVADGGEGTIEALVAVGATEHVVTVTGPRQAETVARFAVRGTTAFVEAAQACGLQLLEPTAEAALRAHSRGVGELLIAALDAGCERIVVGLGGSACTDGGAGMAQALGARLLDDAGTPVAAGGGGLAALATVDTRGLDPRLARTEVVAACDVRSPLVGPVGAAHVYGPQKGAGPHEVGVLDRALENYAQVIGRAVGRDIRTVPGGGAAGGLAAGLVAFLDARIASGGELVLDLLEFERALAGVDLVITGEGRLDDQSLAGKAPVAVAELARRSGVPTIAVAGLIDIDNPAELERYFESTWSMVGHAGKQRALHDSSVVLTSVASDAVAAWLGSGSATGVSPLTPS